MSYMATFVMAYTAFAVYTLQGHCFNMLNTGIIPYLQYISIYRSHVRNTACYMNIRPVDKRHHKPFSQPCTDLRAGWVTWEL